MSDSAEHVPFQIIGTHEALDRLDNATVVQEMNSGMVWIKYADGEGGFFWAMFGDGTDYKTADIELPVAVITLYKKDAM